MPSLGFLKKKRTREQNSDPSNSSQPNSPVTPTAPKTFEPNPVPTLQTQTSAGSATSQLGPAIQQGQSNQSQQSHHSQQGEPADKPSMHNSHLQHPYVSPPQPTPSPGTQPQNLPRIANLINPPQQDDSSQSYQQQLGSKFPAPPANNGAAGNQQYPAIMSQPQQQQQQIQDQPRVTKGKYSLADFEILRTLGTGSFGRVHLVQSRHNQRFYAVKVLKKAQVVKMKQVEHTNDERKMLGEVKHPFLITLWGTFQDAKNLYMVMDFVEGGELFSLLRKSGVSYASSTTPLRHAIGSVY